MKTAARYRQMSTGSALLAALNEPLLVPDVGRLAISSSDDYLVPGAFGLRDDDVVAGTPQTDHLVHGFGHYSILVSLGVHQLVADTLVRWLAV